MKKLHLLIFWACFALSSASYAQVIDSLGPQALIDTMFAGLDSSKISSGLLSDKTVSVYVPLEMYDGLIDTIVSFDDLLTVPFVLNNMKMGTVTIPDEEQLKSRYAQHNRNQLLVPLIIDYDYHKINDSAFIKGLIDTSGTEWTDTIIGGESPYDLKTFKATAFNYSFIPGNTFRFMYDPGLHLSGKSLPSTLLIDFDDGLGLRTVNAYDTLLVKYSTSGKHDITLYKKVPGNDENERLGKVTVFTKEAGAGDDYADCRFMFSSHSLAYKYDKQLAIVGYDNNGNPIMGNVNVPRYMQAFISIQMGKDKADGTKHNCLKKPLIFIDGINYGYENHVDEFFSWGNKCNELGFENIAKAINLNPLTGEEIMDTRFEHGPEFVRRATDAGYDVIFFDMLYGAADIKLNGLLLEEFIIQMNNGNLQNSACYCKKSYDEIVIIGPSMGGQVSRYALLDMEQNGLNNCVREWISFDSPNAGGNISLSLQHFVEWTAENNGSAFNLFKASKDNLSRKLDRDASKQLLIYHHSEKYKSQGHPDFFAFYNRLEQMGGLPSKCRKVAIANGSLVSVKQDFGHRNGAYGGGELLAEMNLPLHLFTNLSFDFRAKLYAEEGAFISPPKCSFNSSSKYVFSASREHAISKYTPFKSIKCENVNFSGWGYDYSPGGTNNGMMSLDISKQIGKLINITPGISYHDDFGFIPTVSSLAIYPNVWKNNGGALYNVLSNFGQDRINAHLPNYNISPFDAIYGPHTYQKNEAHVYISQGLINWTIEELLMGDYENQLIAGSNAGSSYNFGNLYFNRLKTITVNTGCSLKVFANEPRGYKNRASGYKEQYYADITAPEATEIFHLYTVENCDPTVVTISKGALFQLGDGRDRNAVTHFRKGSKLELQEDGVLHILDGSVLIIEKGARLIYHKGAKIILDGPNAVLQILGEIVLPDAGTKFTFTNTPSMTNGYIDFVQSPKIITTGLTNTIEFTGKNIANKIVRITNGELIINTVHASPVNAIASVKLQNGIVEIDKNSALKTPAAINCYNVNFSGNAINGNTGLVLFAQPGIEISYCRFQNLETGLRIQNIYNTGVTQKLEHNLFNNCIRGIDLFEIPIHIDHSNFTNCVTGLYTHYPYIMRVENTGFSFNMTGISHIGGIGLSGLIKGCNFRNNNMSIKQVGKTNSLTIACTELKNCSTAIYAEGNINMSRFKPDKDFGIPGGDCIMLNNNFFFNMQNGTLDLFNGFNNIIQGNPLIVTNFINGNIDANSLSLLGAAPNVLNVENNYYSPDPSSNSSLYNFFMLTSTASYIGVMGIINPVTAAYTNCAGTLNGGGTVGNGDIQLGGDIQGASENTPGEMVNNTTKDEVLPASGEICVYPVPAGNSLNIELPDLENSVISSIFISSAEGAFFPAQYKISATGIIDINTSGLVNGSYFVIINTNSGVYKKQFIIIH